jgi:hypothetical protein
MLNINIPIRNSWQWAKGSWQGAKKDKRQNAKDKSIPEEKIAN